MENDPITGAEYDVVASLVHEVDGRAFLGKRWRLRLRVDSVGVCGFGWIASAVAASGE